MQGSESAAKRLPVSSSLTLCEAKREVPHANSKEILRKNGSKKPDNRALYDSVPVVEGRLARDTMSWGYAAPEGKEPSCAVECITWRRASSSSPNKILHSCGS